MGKIGEIFDTSYEGMDPEEIAQILDGVAYEVKEGTYSKRLTAEEITEKRRQFVDLQMEVNEISAEIKNFTDLKKLELKPIQSEQSMAMQCIKSKSEIVSGKLFGIDNQETQEMEYYDSSGILVDIRPLKREERQRKIFQLDKKQSNE